MLSTDNFKFEDFRKLAYYYLSLLDGDTHLIEGAQELLYEYGFVDEDEE